MPTFLYKESPDAEIDIITLEALLEKLGPGAQWADEAFQGKSPKNKPKEKNHDFVIVKNPGGMGHTVITHKAIKKGAVVCKYPGQIYRKPNPGPISRSAYCVALELSQYMIDGAPSVGVGYGSLLPALPDKAMLEKHEITLADKRLTPLKEIATANIMFLPDSLRNPTQMVGRAIEDIPKGATLGFDYFNTAYFHYKSFMEGTPSPQFLNRLGGGLFDKKYVVGRPLVIFPKREAFNESIEPYLPRSTLHFLEADGEMRSIPWQDIESGRPTRIELPTKSHAGRIDPQEVFVYMSPVATADFNFMWEEAYLNETKRLLSELTGSRESWKFQKKTDLFVLDITREENKEEITAFIRDRLAALGANISSMRSKDGDHFLSIPAVFCTTQKLKALLAALLETAPAAEKEESKDEKPATTSAASADDLSPEASQEEVNAMSAGNDASATEEIENQLVKRAIEASIEELQAAESQDPVREMGAAIEKEDSKDEKPGTTLGDDLSAEASQEEINAVSVGDDAEVENQLLEMAIKASLHIDTNTEEKREAKAERRAQIADAKALILQELSPQEMGVFIEELQQKMKEKEQHVSTANTVPTGSASLLAASFQQGNLFQAAVDDTRGTASPANTHNLSGLAT